MDIAQFRLDFPEFSDVCVYPSGQIALWSGVAERVISADRFGDMYTTAVELYTAHELVLSSASQSSAAATGVATGGDSGAVTSKSVGSVSVSYDSSGSTEQGAGYFNQTIYGRRYWRLVRLFGNGCYQL